MRELTVARSQGNEAKYKAAERRIDAFTSQLDESNPILTEISDAMTEEGHCFTQMESAKKSGRDLEAKEWKIKMGKASERKENANRKLMNCSAKYEAMMRSIRSEQE